MRKAHHDSGAFFQDDKLQYVCLGYDYTAEHEFGIRDLKNKFGINTEPEPKGLLKYLKNPFKPKINGIDKCINAKVPDNLISSQKVMTVDKKKYKIYYLGTGLDWRTVEQNNSYFRSKIKNEMNLTKEINGWWDEEGFLVASTNQKIILQLLEAFKQLDVAIFLLNSNNPFAGSGLVLSIKSNLSEELLKKF